MQTSIALRRSSFSPTTLALIAALLLAFVFGGASGYLVKAVTTTASITPQQHVAVCPAGSHAVVFYTAGSWSCVSN